MTNELRILIAEDKTLLALDIVDRLSGFGFSNILGPFKTGEEALESAQQNPPDVAVLDIHLAGTMNGIDLAIELNKYAKLPVVFLTNDEDSLALEQSLRIGAVGFINKPFTNNELRMALHSAIGHLGRPMPLVPKASAADEPEVLADRIFVRNGRGKVAVLLEDILWIQSGGGETSKVTTPEHLNGSPKKPLVIGLNLMRLQERLQFAPWLVRCSRYHIVNLRRVERILDTGGSKTAGKTLIVGGEEIPVGDQYRKEVMARLRIL